MTSNEPKKQEIVAVMLPSYNEGQGVKPALENVQRGIVQFPEFDFRLHLVNDASTDDTQYWMERSLDELGLEAKIITNSVNLGVAETAKNVFTYFIEDLNADYIMKTDLDDDFDQTRVIEKLIPYTKTNSGFTIGMRWREFHRDENPYEFDRREDILKVLKDVMGFEDLDPPSSGSWLFKKDFLRDALSHPYIKSYERRWGIGETIAIIGRGLNWWIPVVNIENSSYDPLRRPKDKVDAQYNAYFEAISYVTGISPRKLSPYYNGDKE